MFGTYRTFLALMVVASHLGGIHKIGAYAVFGFYTLSGYLMTLIMQRNYGYTVSGVSRYAANRFLRIYPLYWLSIILSAVLVLSLGGRVTSSFHQAMYFPNDVSGLVRNILLFFPFQELPRLTPPAWALTVEICFYVLIGLGISRNIRITSIWFVVSALYHVVAMIFQFDWQYRYITIPAASLPFATGALIFHRKREFVQRFNRAKGNHGYYLPYIFVSAILANWGLGYFTAQLEGVSFYGNYILCALMVVVLSERKELPYINKKIDTWLGDFSYPMYLFHYQMGLVVVVACRAAGMHLKRPELVLMLLSIPLIFVFSLIITVAVERPIELLRSKIKS